MKMGWSGIYTAAKRVLTRISHLKSNNYLTYAMAALHAKKQQWNEAFVLNTERVCDATIANIFIIKNEVIYTPSLKEGCVAGIMRRFLLENLPLHGFRTTAEASITPEDLLAADEVFVSNAVRGLRG